MTQREGAEAGSESSGSTEPTSPPVPEPDPAPIDPSAAVAASSSDVSPDRAQSSDENAAAEPPASPRPPTLEEQLEEAREQQRRTREQLLRAAADYDNLRKRSRRDVDDAKRRAAMATIRELLPVFDNLERAASVQTVVDTAAIADGLRLVLRQFVETLRKLGVDRIDAVGGPFDPTTQESLQMVESVDSPPGSVVAVIQPGYRMGADLLRPAMVVVSKGPAATAEPASGAASSPPEEAAPTQAGEVPEPAPGPGPEGAEEPS
jgi:molecular chaperone GrpE